MPRDIKPPAQISAANERWGWRSQLVSAYNCVPLPDLLPSSSPFQDLFVVVVKQGGDGLFKDTIYGLLITFIHTLNHTKPKHPATI